MDALPGADFAVAEKDRLYRCPDRVLAAKAEITSGPLRDGIHGEIETARGDREFNVVNHPIRTCEFWRIDKTNFLIGKLIL
jgi:hypothetical protein